MAQWIRVGGAGAAGPAGSSGSGTPAAPNVTGATFTAVFAQVANTMKTVIAGTFTLNTSDPNYSQDVKVEISAVDPNGNKFQVATITGSPIGSPASFSNANGQVIQWPNAVQTGWTLVFTAYNTAGNPTSGPFTSSTFSIGGIAGTGGNGLTSVTAAEIGPVYQDQNQGLHTVISITPTINTAQLPLNTTLWLDNDDGNGPQIWGSFLFTDTGQSWVLGQATANSAGVTQAGSIWVPTDPSQSNWTAYLASGVIQVGLTTWSGSATYGVGACVIYSANVYQSAIPRNFGLTPGSSSSWVQVGVSASFTVSVAAACLPTDCTNIQFVANSDTGDLINYAAYGNDGYVWIFNELNWLQPTATYDPYYQYSMCTVQKGYAQTGTCTITTTSGVSTLNDSTATFTVGQVGNVVHVAGVWNTIAGFTDATHVTLTTVATNGSGIAYEIWNPAPDMEGSNDDPDLLYYGRQFCNSGDPNGGPEVLGSIVVINGDNPPDWTFPAALNPDGSTNLYRMFKFENYAVSRLGQNPNGGPASGTYTRQIGWPGGADHFYLTPAVQPSALDLSRATSTSTGKGLIVSGSALQANLATPLAFLSQQITIATGGISTAYLGASAVTATNMAANAVTVANGALSAAVVQASNMAANAVTAANGALAANSVVDSNVASVGVSKLISGTVIFTGNVFFSQGSGNPVIELSNTGIFLFGVAASGGGSGLTSSPYIAIESSGISLYSDNSTTSPIVTISSSSIVLTQGTSNPVMVLQNSGMFLYSTAASGGGSGVTTSPYVAVQNTGIGVFSGGNPSVTVDSSSVNVWSVNGNTADPFVSVASSGVTIQNGNFAAVVQAAQIKLSFSTTVTAVLTSAGLTLTNGSYSTTIGSTSIVLTNGTNSVTINSTGVSIVNGIISITSGATTINLDSTNQIKVSKSGYFFQLGTGISTAFGSEDGLIIVNSAGSQEAIYTVAGMIVGSTSGFSGAYTQVSSSGVSVNNGSLVASMGPNNVSISGVTTGASAITVNGNQVLSTRVTSTPITLSDVIGVLQHHGLSN